ncbi:MAG: tRNA threonylcarbamoyladenosine dehydratase [Ruminococcaceae bacterium]|nr:tRNA threonylcarbamoyladenosine dehydratase [Oscillospiraceae bacterium]
MPDQYSRTRLLLGGPGMDKLRASRVAVFGLGGVGGYAAEALARSGIGQLDLVDDDVIGLTNLNRQILALHSTVGMPKVEVAAQRIRDIDPTIQIRTYKTFYLPETAEQFDFSQYDYVLDAIDTVTGKLELIAQAKAANVPIISCMGTGNKLDATGFRVSDISKTSGCALARIMRKECAKRGLKGVKVVWSEELPLEPHIDPATDPESHREGSSRRALPGSTAFVPGVAGLIMAGEVIKDLSDIKEVR